MALDVGQAISVDSKAEGMTGPLSMEKPERGQSTGGAHGLGLREDGTLLGWGANESLARPTMLGQGRILLLPPCSRPSLKVGTPRRGVWFSLNADVSAKRPYP